MTGLNVAVLGATGAVGRELLQILEERRFPVGDIKLLASPRSAGQMLPFAGHEIEVQAVTRESFKDVDIAFFSAGGSVSREYAEAAVKANAVVIDNTSAFRMEEDVPLVVPEVNPEDIFRHHGIIANPNCSTIIMVVVLKPLHDLAGLKRLVVSTYQAVSGAGARAIDELEKQVRCYVEGKEITSSILPYAGARKHYQIAFNVIPHIDSFLDNGYTKEEMKMVNETRKILGYPELLVTATTVRVPVFRSHAESVNLEFKEHISVKDARRVLRSVPGVKVLDNPDDMEYPMPTGVAGKDDVFVGRIRLDETVRNGLNLWIAGDQIRKGAALNAVQIAEKLIEGE